VTDAHPPSAALVPRFISAVQWNTAISLATAIIQVGIVAAVARPLAPSDFGLYALANVMLVMARNFGDRGLITAIAREPVLDREVIGSAVLISCILAPSLALIVFGFAPLAATGSSAEERRVLEGLFRLTSMSLLISGLGAPAQAMMQRELRFREYGFLQLGGILIGTGGVTIVLAAAHYGPWSLVWGEIVNTALIAAGAWWTMRKRWAIAWPSTHTIRMGVVGMQMTVLRLLDVLWTQLPLVLAKAHLASFEVGLYQRGQTLADMGVQYTTGRVSAVLFPVMASRQDQEAFLRRLIPPMVGLYSLVLFPAATFVVLMAPDIVAVLLGSAWQNAAAPLAVIMVAFTILHSSQPASALLEAGAVFGPRMLGAALGAGVLLLVGSTLIAKLGLMGIAIAAIFSATVTALVYLVTVVRRFGVSPQDLFGWLCRSAVVSAFLGAAMTACNPFLFAHVPSPVARLGAMGVVAAAAMVVGFRLLAGKKRRRTLGTYLTGQLTGPALAVARLLGLDV
jgi:PST family polysaccharide transporter